VTDLLQRVEASIHRRQLLKRGEKILIAVSGGLDSMTLLHTLKILSTQNKWEIFVAHFNHQLRGRSSRADERLVRQTAAEMRLPFVASRADVKKFAQKSKISIEMAARKLRHDFFARAARARKIKVIALAHHADDQVELFFLRLFRGAGGEGLAGMKWRSPSPADKKMPLIRPLLALSKEELRTFAREKKIRFRDDATNFSSDFLRNRIRNELLPLLRKKYQPGLDKAVLRLMEIVGAESELTGNSAAEWLAQRKPDFASLPVATQRRVLLLQLARVKVSADFDLVESLRESPGIFASASPEISVARDFHGEVKLKPSRPAGFDAGSLIVNLAGRKKSVVFSKTLFDWRFDTVKKFIRPKGRAGREFFDADKVSGKIILRHWRAGDRFQPIGLKSPVKLQDLFTNAKIPRERRRGLIVAESADGEIFWVEGLRISENFKLTPETKRRLAWNWQKAV
jgi:tRNA(Ile)-lysidine synthase